MKTKEVAEFPIEKKQRVLDFAIECCYLKQLPEYKAFEQYVEEWLEDSDVGDYIYDLAVARDRYLIENRDKILKEYNLLFPHEDDSSEKPLEKAFVYLARCDSTPGIYKIGKSKGLATRESCLKCGNIYLKIVASVQLASEKEAYKFETYLHKLFADKCVEREWFEISEEGIQLLVDLFHFQFAVES